MTQETQYQEVAAGTESAEAFGVRYENLSAVQAAKINSIRDYVLHDLEDDKARRSSGVKVNSFFGTGYKLDESGIAASDTNKISAAKLKIEKVAAKADNLVRKVRLATLNASPQNNPNIGPEASVDLGNDIIINLAKGMGVNFADLVGNTKPDFSGVIRSVLEAKSANDHDAAVEEALDDAGEGDEVEVTTTTNISLNQIPLSVLAGEGDPVKIWLHRQKLRRSLGL